MRTRAAPVLDQKRYIDSTTAASVRTSSTA